MSMRTTIIDHATLERQKRSGQFAEERTFCCLGDDLRTLSPMKQVNFCIINQSINLYLKFEKSKKYCLPHIWKSN